MLVARYDFLLKRMKMMFTKLIKSCNKSTVNLKGLQIGGKQFTNTCESNDIVVIIVHFFISKQQSEKGGFTKRFSLIY